MSEKVWRTVAIILIAVVVASIFYFIIKGYKDYKYIRLTKVETGKRGTLNDLLKRNYSGKRFKKKKLELAELTEILWAGYGKTQSERRTVTSLLNFPLKLYICIDENNIQYLNTGIYEYKSDIHNLKLIEEDNYKEKLVELLKLKGKIPVILIITIDEDVVKDQKEKVFFELGEVVANILLKTRELKMKIKIIDSDSFQSKEVMNILELDDEKPIMLMLIGK